MINVPPSLDYDLVKRRKSQIIIFSVIILVNAGLPALLFYTLRHLTTISPVALYGATSAIFALGLTQLPLRAFLLLRNGGERSVVPRNQSGAPAVQRPDAKWYHQFDVFQWEVSNA